MKIPFGKPSPVQKLDSLNWPDSFPYKPEVGFSVWHDGDNFHITYTVREKTTRAVQTVLGAPVYEDSCVECFIQPEPDTDPHYYNFEWNAAGKLAMACRTGRNDPENAPLDVLESVIVNPSLGKEPFDEKAIDGEWKLEVTIPATALFKHGIKSWSGRRMKMNFFKCGDGLKEMHFVTWAPISTPKPDYHRPEYFQTIEFE